MKCSSLFSRLLPYFIKALTVVSALIVNRVFFRNSRRELKVFDLIIYNSV